MRSEVCDIGGEEYIRVNKKAARTAWYNGLGVVLMPSMVNPCGGWFNPTPSFNDGSIDFDKMVNEFEYYNCNTGLGKTTKFFVHHADVPNGAKDASSLLINVG